MTAARQGRSLITARDIYAGVDRFTQVGGRETGLGEASWACKLQSRSFKWERGCSCDVPVRDGTDRTARFLPDALTPPGRDPAAPAHQQQTAGAGVLRQGGATTAEAQRTASVPAAPAGCQGHPAFTPFHHTFHFSSLPPRLTRFYVSSPSTSPSFPWPPPPDADGHRTSGGGAAPARRPHRGRGARVYRAQGPSHQPHAVPERSAAERCTWQHSRVVGRNVVLRSWPRWLPAP